QAPGFAFVADVSPAVHRHVELDGRPGDDEVPALPWAAHREVEVVVGDRAGELTAAHLHQDRRPESGERVAADVDLRLIADGALDRHPAVRRLACDGERVVGDGERRGLPELQSARVVAGQEEVVVRDRHRLFGPQGEQGDVGGDLVVAEHQVNVARVDVQVAIGG